ncbi:MAG: hypothetical protein CVT48_06440 [Thermoplasmata archaeon HGW-Thermoplasmata-1]|nr:MAG: hypothetical protein CVT48_06440 [Thermoplasmata archaeon HGW-Thermoplasmata-1]
MEKKTKEMKKWKEDADDEVKILKDNGEKVVASVPNQDLQFTARLNDLVVTTIIDAFVRKRRANSKVVLEAAEQFGRRVFEECMEKREKWTPYEWVVGCITKIFNRQGTGVTFTIPSNGEVMAIIHKCPTPERARISPEVACAFSWGYVRGLWRAAFPDGEVVMKGTMAMGYPTCGFVLKEKASAKDKKHVKEIKDILHKMAEPKV